MAPANGVIRFVDEDKRNPRTSGLPSDSQVRGSELEDLYRGLQPEMRRPKPGPDALAAALEAVQRLAAEADAEQAADDTAQEPTNDSTTIVCRVCGYRNRRGNKFCGMCGVTVSQPEEPESGVPAEEERPPSRALVLPPNAFSDHEPEAEIRPTANRTSAQETHHYHHHYHHHYFPGGPEGMGARSGGDAARVDPARDLRPTAALRGDMSRAEAAVRHITHEWVLACNTKHLDDLLDLYVADALVLRSNCPPIRGAAAVREFFFGALDAGLGEVEVEPLRVEVVGDLAYEAGRCKALIPSATGKRREERGKYLWVCARQSNGEWKLAADCWSSDLTLSMLESDIPQSAAVKTAQPRKNS
jgi:ketosteroid isomerase-like protein